MCEVNKIEPRVHNNWGRSSSLAFCMCSCDPSAVISHFQREACLAYFIMVLICTGGLFLQKREKTQAKTMPGFIPHCSCAGRHLKGLWGEEQCSIQLLFYGTLLLSESDPFFWDAEEGVSALSQKLKIPGRMRHQGWNSWAFWGKTICQPRFLPGLLPGRIYSFGDFWSGKR